MLAERLNRVFGLKLKYNMLKLNFRALHMNTMTFTILKSISKRQFYVSGGWKVHQVFRVHTRVKRTLNRSVHCIGHKWKHTKEICLRFIHLNFYGFFDTFSNCCTAITFDAYIFRWEIDARNFFLLFYLIFKIHTTKDCDICLYRIIVHG